MNNAFYANFDQKTRFQKMFDELLVALTAVSQISCQYKTLIMAKRIHEKYDNLIVSGIYSNSLEGKYDHAGANQKVNFNYVFKSFSSIDETEIKVTDGDVQAYYNAHKDEAQYKQNAGRNITFARIPLQASAEDAAAIEADLSCDQNGLGKHRS